MTSREGIETGGRSQVGGDGTGVAGAPMFDRSRTVQEDRHHLAVISAVAKDAIVIIGAHGEVVHWNRAAESMFGYTRADVIGKALHDFLAPDRFRDEHRAAFGAFRRTGMGGAIGRTIELAALCHDGSEIPVELSLSAVAVEGGWSAVGIIRDIRERLRLQAAVEEKAAFLDALLNALPVPVFSLDPNGRIVVANPAFASFSGISAQALAGRTLEEIGQAPLASSTLDGAASGAADLAQPIDLRLEDSSGGSHDTVLHRGVILDESGAARWTIGVVLDVTERRAMEADLAHARKLEAVGQLAAGIAHEINTPTQYVGDSLAFLREAFDVLEGLRSGYGRACDALERSGGHEDLLRDVRAAEAAADLPYLETNVPDSFTLCADGIRRITTIVQAMRDFAHPDAREKSPADLNQALRNTLTIAHHAYKYVAEIVTDFEDIPHVHCHVGDLNQVFLNLIVNAAHAIESVVGESGARGTITVRTRSENGNVVVEISDTGCGMSEDVRQRLFEPFFTTKPVGKGTGQGLTIARSVVVGRHKGALTFDSQVGRGTSFFVKLPVSETTSERRR